MLAAVPDIEENIPLPTSAAEALPPLSPKEELDVRVRTIKLLSDITERPIDPNSEERSEAESLAKQMIADPKLRPDFSKYSNETMAYLAGMVAQANCMIVDDLAELKLYVVNKLVYEVEHAKDPKHRIAALSKLGEIDGVDAFKRRSEMTVKVQPIEEVEKELFNVLDALEVRVVDEPLEEDRLQLEGPEGPERVQEQEQETPSCTQPA